MRAKHSSRYLRPVQPVTRAVREIRVLVTRGTGEEAKTAVGAMEMGTAAPAAIPETALAAEVPGAIAQEVVLAAGTEAVVGIPAVIPGVIRAAGGPPGGTPVAALAA